MGAIVERNLNSVALERNNNMKLSELKEKLNKLPAQYDNCEVVCQQDAEGNGYSPLAGIDPFTVYIPETTFSGNVYSTSYSAADNCMEEDEWEKIKNDKSLAAIVLFPVN